MWLYEYAAYVFALSLFCLYPFVLFASGHWVVQCVLCLCSRCCVLRINMISCPWGVATGLGRSLFTALLIPLAPDLQPLTFYPLTIYALTATQWVNLRDYRVNAKTEYFKHLGKHEKEICSHFGTFCALDELWSHIQTKPLISIYFFTSQNLDSVQPHLSNMSIDCNVDTTWIKCRVRPETFFFPVLLHCPSSHHLFYTAPGSCEMSCDHVA